MRLKTPPPQPMSPEGSEAKPSGSRGFVLALTIFLILGVTAISVGTMFNGKMGRMSAINYKHKIQTFSASDGLMTLLAQEIINGNGDKYVDTSRVGMIYGQEWTGISGYTMPDLYSAMAGSPTPSKIITSDYLGSYLPEEFYGLKWTGWLIPPLSGNYTFYSRADDASAFFISSDSTKGHLPSSPACYLDSWVYKWPKTGTGLSKPIPLVAGNHYYFEFYHINGCCFGIGQIGWDGPEYFAERPISGKYLSQYASDPAWAGTVTVGGLPVKYQVVGAGLDKFRLSTEAYSTKPGDATDTLYRTPLVQSISLKGKAVAPAPALYLRVIHYDFKSDYTIHPEFDPPWDAPHTYYTDGVIPDMVQHKLTTFTPTDAAYFGRPKIPKPSHYLNTPNRSCGLDTWFRKSTPGGTVYDYPTPGDCSVSHPDISGQLANTKYYDSLKFNLDVSQGPSTYVYSHMGNYDTGDPTTSWRGDPSEYFPLDWVGQDPAGSGHNFAFCTELHTTFQYQSGLIFEFTGDDDVWTFVNDSLVIDLGGMHQAASVFLNLDNLNSLKFGNTYDFDFFQCERHEQHSSSRMVTNIKMALPTGNPVASWRRDYGSLD